MTEIAFDFTSAAVGTRSISAQISSPPVTATFTSTASPLSGIPSSINRFHTFSVYHSGSNEGAGQGYAYVQLTSDVPIRLTRVHFYTQGPFHNQAAGLAIEAAETSNFSASAVLATKSLLVAGFGGADVDLPTDLRLRDGTNYIRFRLTTPADTNQTWMDYSLIKIEVEADNEGAYPSVELVAKALAPKIRFHPSERHFPCSVEWFVGRCRLLSGGGELQPDKTAGFDIATHFRIPDGMSVLSEGPLDPYNLPAATLVDAGSRTDGGEVDNISLCPMEASRNGQAAWNHELSTRIYFSDYELETLWGQTGDSSTWRCYCRITRDGDNYRINYYFLCAYNGGMGTADWDDSPLEGGFYAHIGDWMRVTAIVSFSKNGTTQENLTTLHAVEYEVHGEVTTKTGGAWSFSDKELYAIQPILAYSAWHSHEMYPAAGTFPVPGFQGIVIHDVTADGGVEWSTWDLTWIDDDTPWVGYKGLWGPNIQLYNSYVRGLPTMKNGPSGPAFKTAWFKGTQHHPQLFHVIAGGPNTADVLEFAVSAIDYGTFPNGQSPVRDLIIRNKTSDRLSILVQVVSAAAADRTSRRVGEWLYPPVLSLRPPEVLSFDNHYETTLLPNKEKILKLKAEMPLPPSGGLNVYSPSDFKGYVAANVVNKSGWITLTVTGGINGGKSKPGIGDHVPIKDSDIPPLDLSERATY
jgi:hypothetical protein